eukprot:COSAG06_NODE_4707_length_4023_cov_5.646789_1_plen_125_part_00
MPRCAGLDKQRLLERVAQDGRALRYAAAELQADKEIVATAVAQDGRALRYSNSNLCTKLATTPGFPGEPPPSDPNGTPEPSQHTRERVQKRSTCAPKPPSWGRILPHCNTGRGTRSTPRCHFIQ